MSPRGALAGRYRPRANGLCANGQDSARRRPAGRRVCSLEKLDRRPSYCAIRQLVHLISLSPPPSCAQSFTRKHSQTRARACRLVLGAQAHDWIKGARGGEPTGALLCASIIATIDYGRTSPSRARITALRETLDGGVPSLPEGHHLWTRSPSHGRSRSRSCRDPELTGLLLLLLLLLLLPPVGANCLPVFVFGQAGQYVAILIFHQCERLRNVKVLQNGSIIVDERRFGPIEWLR